MIASRQSTSSRRHGLCSMHCAAHNMLFQNRSWIKHAPSLPSYRSRSVKCIRQAQRLAHASLGNQVRSSGFCASFVKRTDVLETPGSESDYALLVVTKAWWVTYLARSIPPSSSSGSTPKLTVPLALVGLSAPTPLAAGGGGLLLGSAGGFKGLDSAGQRPGVLPAAVCVNFQKGAGLLSGM